MRRKAAGNPLQTRDSFRDLKLCARAPGTGPATASLAARVPSAELNPHGCFSRGPSRHGGSESHSHGIGKGADNGSGFQAEGDECRLVVVNETSNLPPYLNVRFIVKVKG